MFASSRFVTRLAPAASATAAVAFVASATVERKASATAAGRMFSSSSRFLLNQSSTFRSSYLYSTNPSSSFRTSANVSSIRVSPNTTIRRSFSAKETPATTATTTKAAAAAIKPASSSSSEGGGGGLVAWYEGHLQTRPVATKMVTGSLLWGIGDAVAQVVPAVAAGKTDQFQYDTVRTARAAFFGFALHAPLSHLHFNFLEWMTVKAGLTGLQIPVFKTIMEQFVYWSWISNSLYHGAMGLLQGFSFQQCYDRIADVLWDTQVAQWVFWIPIQLINFQFTPVRHQLNVVLLTSIVWTALLSAWYPPQEEEQEAKVEDDTKKISMRRMKSASLMTTPEPPKPDE